MYKYLLPLLLLLPATLSSSESPQFAVEQATFLVADEAQVFNQNGKALIQTKGLEQKPKPGLVLLIEGLEDPEIEVTRLITITIDGQELELGVYPPQKLKPSEEDGAYRIVGEPGNRYGVVADDDPPFYVQIDGESPPIDPPPPENDLESLREVVSLSVQTLDDPVTQEYIVTELEKLENPSADQIKEAIRTGLRESMKVLDPPYKDWENGFRVPVNEEIKKLEEPNLSQVVDVIVEAMK